MFYFLLASCVMIDSAVSFVCAVILGLGIGIGGMLDPGAAQRLFNAPVLLAKSQITYDQIDMTLMIVFMSGLVTNFILYHVMMNVFKRPLLGGKVLQLHYQACSLTNIMM